ncbi:MAG: recombinase family protein [Cytophagaceae bacterium]|nr:recombinase family protein [Cytophagaceae bacterium]
MHKLKVNFKLPVIIEDVVNKKGGRTSARKYSISSKSLVKSTDQTLNVGNYSTVIGSSPKIAEKSIKNKSFSLKMSVEFISSNLWNPPYSDYQMFLFQTIEDFTKKGWNYVQIAEWLNKNRYKTPRGKKFRQNHVWSIHVKKKRSIERFSREYQPKITSTFISVIAGWYSRLNLAMLFCFLKWIDQTWLALNFLPLGVRYLFLLN